MEGSTKQPTVALKHRLFQPSRSLHVTVGDGPTQKAPCERGSSFHANERSPNPGVQVNCRLSILVPSHKSALSKRFLPSSTTRKAQTKHPFFPSPKRLATTMNNLAPDTPPRRAAPRKKRKGTPSPAPPPNSVGPITLHKTLPLMTTDANGYGTVGSDYNVTTGPHYNEKK